MKLASLFFAMQAFSGARSAYFAVWLLFLRAKNTRRRRRRAAKKTICQPAFIAMFAQQCASIAFLFTP
jgi:hypothetical protein